MKNAAQKQNRLHKLIKDHKPNRRQITLNKKPNK